MEPRIPTDAIRPLLRARQVRQFSGEPVEPAALDAIADAARWSGSSQNSQPWRFVIVRERSTLQAIHKAGLPSTRSLATAAAAIAIVMPQRPGGGISIAFDEGRAAERILIAASMLDLGAGIAWIKTEVRLAVASLLSLPDDRFVRTVVSIGHPSDAGRRPKSAPGEARLPREDVVFAERWPA
ncbi:MAG TPA: nitroreductase family protein [Candidatus Limnocylindria bacterium]